MDFAGSLYSVFGVTGPLYLCLEALVALLMAISLSCVALESARIFREYTAKEKPAALPKPVKGEKPVTEEKPAPPAEKAEKIYITGLPTPEAKPTAPPVSAPSPAAALTEVVRDSLPDSMKAITAKYGLKWLTIATGDGLVIASTSNTPDEDAAVYSNLFHELYRTRAEPYFNVPGKDIHLLQVEIGEIKFIDIAGRAGTMTRDEVSGLRDDSRRIVERFVFQKK